MKYYSGSRTGKVHILWSGHKRPPLRWTGAYAHPTRERMYLIETKIAINADKSDVGFNSLPP